MSGAAVRRIALALVLALASTRAPAARADEPAGERLWLHAEVDPLPFLTGGYGGQIGVRPPGLGGVRLAVASFALDVPDIVAQFGDNDGFTVRVRPSAAVYALYYLEDGGADGPAFGVALRYLRLRYRHVDEPGLAEVRELSPEAIVAYQWHPARARAARGFYLQAWFGLSVTALRDGERVVGSQRYDALPVQPFFTVNLGWELAP